MENEIWLGIAGFLLGIFAVLFGGSMFLSLPVFTTLFPCASFGAIVASIKAGSFVRGFFSTVETRKELKLSALPLYLFLLVGGVFGALSNASLSQDFVLPAVIFGILLATNSNSISRFIGSDSNTHEAKHIFAFAVGVYGGFFGAGVSLLILALVRVFQPEDYGDDDELAEAKIQARFLEFVLVIFAIGGHLVSGSLTSQNANMWLPWVVGSALGGIIGAKFLIKLKDQSERWQRRVLYAAFAVALISAIFATRDGGNEAGSEDDHSAATRSDCSFST